MLEEETFIKREKVEENVERVTVKIVYFNIYIYINISILFVRITKEINF